MSGRYITPSMLQKMLCFTSVHSSWALKSPQNKSPHGRDTKRVRSELFIGLTCLSLHSGHSYCLNYDGGRLLYWKLYSTFRFGCTMRAIPIGAGLKGTWTLPHFNRNCRSLPSQSKDAQRRLCVCYCACLLAGQLLLCMDDWTMVQVAFHSSYHKEAGSWGTMLSKADSVQMQQ
jgi:hypothetical protein